MPESTISRRNFIVGIGAAVGLAAVPLVLQDTEASAAAAKDIPWAYTTQDPLAVAKRSYEVYYAGGCAEATWYSIVEALANDSSNPDQLLWASLPKKLFAFGGGGISGWGTVCGTCNGSAAAIKAVGAPNNLVDAVMLYYAETPLPTNGVELAVAAGGWTPAKTPRPNVPTCVGHTQLCHASISAWTTMTGFADGGPEQQDRCAKACFDMTKKTVELLNEWKATGALPTVKLDPYATACASDCHSAKGIAPQKTKMACDSCHDTDVHPVVK
ncbi:MAG: hypothetical protein ABFC80_02990 [Coriobacteriales bacterium]|nr:hypothetical protein [Actinomycetes bacterium]